MKRVFSKVLAHLSVVFSLAALVVCVVDGINAKMGFLTCTWGRVLLIIAVTLSLLLAVRTVLRGNGG